MSESATVGEAGEGNQHTLSAQASVASDDAECLATDDHQGASIEEPSTVDDGKNAGTANIVSASALPATAHPPPQGAGSVATTELGEDATGEIEGSDEAVVDGEQSSCCHILNSGDEETKGNVPTVLDPLDTSVDGDSGIPDENSDVASVQVAESCVAANAQASADCVLDEPVADAQIQTPTHRETSPMAPTSPPLTPPSVQPATVPAEAGSSQTNSAAGGGATTRRASSEPEAQALSHDIMSDIIALPGNHLCIDCGVGRPLWASLTFGTLMCLECCGAHRAMGVHLSFMRSLNLDNWTPKQVACMRVGGNDALRSFFAHKGVQESGQQRYHTPAAALYRMRSVV
jgi:hypothetical protein